MSWCERSLADHVDCVKSFLRDARMNDLKYEPGTYGENDRCATTRHAYVECTQDPIRKANALSVAQQSGTGPPPCEMELSIHSKCIERFLRTALATSTDYVFLTHKGTNKCISTRDAFDKCMKQAKQIAAGAMDPTSVPQHVSKHSLDTMTRVQAGPLKP
mmetsp:Transcript_116746/g.310628  ORF Transcript_116746/g.310628 Transcript_116746/m.310628 type:complete len:160 (-) Transcript_116746:124-603(-)|eukprot:CAMPEP_0171237320 /NCGR_PEP_ID=MMETSP0790-20130122/42908_1 /TAXON_ID=2925 /ORGANISM="Alexandrium catenella, Strain OF101" /LENGTH=159 /DNA_ID=CAMNT_0011703673 /DNA_START=67 /DNA_END=546 /DNA_ORIENTATION=-